MKKILVFLLLMVFSLPFISAQDNKFAVGDKVVNAGIGFGNVILTGLGYKTTVPPLSISFEKGIKDGILDKGIIGVGGYLGYLARKWETMGTTGAYGWKYSNLIIGARGVFHYPLVDKLDSYAGIIVGYNISTSRSFGVTSGSDPYAGGGPVFSGYVGGRYYLNDKFAAMGELGYGITWLNLGLAVKL